MLSRTIYPRRRGRRLLALVAGLGLVAALMASAAVALAVWDKGLFELDTSSSTTICAPLAAPCGDANVADQAAAGDDWANVYKSYTGLGTAGPDSAFGRTFLTDPVSSAENSYYTGGGSKDVNDIPQWQYATSNDVVPDKDDLAHAFAAAYHTPAISPRTGTDTIVYFGVDRYDNNGDAETGFWFFKNKVSLVNGKFTGEHAIGDVLVLADWGGSNPVGLVTVYDWVGGRNPLRLVSDNAAADCAVAAPDANYCAVVNRQTVNQPWSFTDKAASTSIRSLELFEAGINMTKTFGEDRCFASFLASTRSSHSTTAQLKDLVLGSFEQCGAAISIAASDTNDVNDAHTFTVTVTKSVGGTPSPAAGVVPIVTLTDQGGNTVTPTSQTCSAGTTAAGTCTVTVNSSVGKTITAHATATVTIGTDSFDVATDGIAPNSGDAVKRYVNGTIDISPDATNEVGDEHTFTITVQKDTGTGNGLVAATGENPVVTLTDEDGNTVNPTADTCASPGTNASGECLVKVNSSVGTTITAHAEVDIDFAATGTTPALANVHRETGSVSNPDSVKTYVDASIAIVASATNEVGQGHTFTVSVKQDTGNGDGLVNVPDGTMPTVTLTDANGATITDVTDNCALTGTAGGECTIDFNSTTTGTVTGHAAISLTLGGIAVDRATDGSGNNSGDAVKTYVDAYITIAQSATNEVNDDHTFTITVKQDIGDGNGFVNVPDGTNPVVSLTDQDDAAVASFEDLCASTGTSAGQCTVTVNSTIGVTITAHAAITLSLGGIDVPRETDGTGNNSGDAVKRYVDGSITIETSDSNDVNDDHVFTVTVMADNGTGMAAAAGAIPTITLTDEGGATVTPASETCSAGTDALGQCTVTVNSTVGTTITAGASVSLTFVATTNPVTPELTITRSTDGTGGNSDAAVKRYVDGWITIEETATNQVNVAHVFTVTVYQDAGAGDGLVAAAGVIPTITLKDAADADVTPSDETCSLGTDALGQCTVTVNSAVGIVITANASVDLTFAATADAPEITITRATDGTGNNSGSAVKTYVDAYITIGTNGVNTVGDPHVFTVTVKVDNGTGTFANAPDGTMPTVTWDSDDITNPYIDDQCAAIGTVNGTCTYTVNSAVQGTITVHAAVTVELGGIDVHRETDGLGNNSGDATKIYVAGSISWSKTDDAGEQLGGAVFTVCQTETWTLPSGPPVSIDPADQVCFDVTDNVDPDGSISDGEFFLGGLALGTYSVTEKTAPDGYLLDPDTEFAYLTDTQRTDDIEVAFVDSREILKITGFGYTNELVVEDDGLPTHGVTHGITTFTAVLHNYGAADASLTHSSLSVSTSAAEGVACWITGDITEASAFSIVLDGPLAAGASTDPIQITCEYDHVDGGTTITADLTVKSTTNGVEREASGSPAQIRFTVQED